MTNNPYRIDLDNEVKTKPKGPKNILALGLVLVGLVIGLIIGFVFAKSPIERELFSDDKAELIIEYMDNYWLYADEYEDLAAYMKENGYYGMTTFLDDPYTTYLNSDDLNDFTTNINNDFVGVGVTYIVLGDYPIIKEVLADSPAEEAGIKTGDILLKIGEKSTYGLTSEEVKELVLGNEGENVAITLRRATKEMEITVKRAHVTSTVKGYEINDMPVLNITSFGETTYDECIEFLNNYKDNTELIIDLRDNTGGYQDAVINIAGLFLDDEAIVMKTIDKNEREEISYAKSDTKFLNFEDIIILTNAQTASASEVLTLALLEEHPNARSLGETTYGKGVMQTTFPLSDGSAIKITSAKWVSSSDKWINGVGIKPNIEVVDDAIFTYPYLSILDTTYGKGSSDETIKIIKAGLRYLGYELKEDSLYDDVTQNALEDFYETRGSTFNEVIDEEVYLDILSACWSLKASDYQKDVQLYSAVSNLGA